MRLYCTDQGIGREDEPGVLSLLDLPWPTVDALVRSGNLDAARTAPTVRALPIGQASLSAPVRRPGKVLIVGLNYPSHAEEALEMFAAMGRTDVALPAEPNFQVLAGSSVVGAGQPIRLPAVAPDQVDYEGELAVVIGRDATDVRPDDAWGHVAGLSIANDVSARDIQRRAMTGDPVASIGVAKSFDTFTPLGPCLVTADEFTGPLDLRIRTLVNGELRQDDRTSNFLHSVPDLIAHISRYQTLEAGDIICTGTPRGAGVFSHRFLRPGDVVEVEVERVGSLRNEVVGE
ncbi:2-keto-4-pentenoate hydratase/2-oxohepta-3-ene-1,7-dioic acid hydratase in catechol pathway [Rhodococcus sp. LBL1]|nr:2-keto-4-pentenoate hydratase/2-oxohepta-3-ene-1,7-dioic acid hydratase in catechol pathway [Rhodococcus sp. LBL1]MDH6684495.1 2-keto-4-pentenoate hydratase/2-oxohepta-3-ene-1,7-dioic acid hydratase in catechol pathway [Rhodococcus sp. LBL2]